ncbi:MATE family efflux transporter [Paenibacillus sp. MWE-103]|uniref:Probable multidrug resistance protein NorM n=1 Tax=Paenibacillus artemisiicola TaxID=1172618 RepID=A0ABS3WKT9_9BACL|nr:MATE family efflux transporter [Paenibacillus artemisiicola]
MEQPAYRQRRQAFLERFLARIAIGDYRALLSLYLPILIDQAFIIGLSMLNTAMISSSGVAAVSAVNIVDSLNMFLISVFVAVSTGGTVIVAQYKGSGNLPMVPKAAASSVSSVTLFAVVIGLAMIALHGPALNLLFGAASPDVFAKAKTYFIGSCASFAGIALTEAVCGALRGIGRSRASLTLSLIMNLSYVLLNVLFINVMHMGVLGMSISINIARYGAALFALYYILKLDTNLHLRIKDIVRVRFEMVKRILYVGLPFAAEQMFFNGGKIVTQIFIVHLGTNAIAVNAIGGSFAGLTQIPSAALSIAAITVVGQAMGRQNVEEARRYTRFFLCVSTGFLLITALLVVPLFHPLVSLFHPPEAIKHDIFVIVLINAAMQVPLWSISFIMPSALRAAGDSKFTSIVSLLSMWLFRIVLGYMLGIVFKFGIVGVWLAMNIEWGVRGTIFLLRFRGKKWYRHKLI